MSLTRQQVTEVIGQADDEHLVEIIETGATLAELIEARLWMAGQRRTLGDQQPLRPTIVEEVYDILCAEDPDWDEV
jgi:hypothetical protein